MTACEKIKREIVENAFKDLRAHHACGYKADAKEIAFMQCVDDPTATVNDKYDALCEFDGQQDYEEEFRSGQFETHLPCPGSRHYESKSVAAKLADGSWVGWTYFYGGGKHAEPGAVPWMEDAYDLDVTEEERMVVVREFKRKDAS